MCLGAFMVGGGLLVVAVLKYEVGLCGWGLVRGWGSSSWVEFCGGVVGVVELLCEFAV